LHAQQTNPYVEKNTDFVDGPQEFYVL